MEPIDNIKPGKRVLIICNENRVRSQMAEGLVRHLTKGRVDVKSAGIDPRGVHPIAIKVMREKGIDISSHTSNHYNEFKDDSFNYVITVCNEAMEECTDLVASEKNLHYSFFNPENELEDSDLEEESFRRVRDEIYKFIRKFIKTELVG